MMLILNLILLSLYHYLTLANSQLINNPVSSQNILENIVNYSIRLNSINIKNEERERSQDFSLIPNLKKIYYQSYISDIDFFIFTDNSDNNFLLFEHKYYSMERKNEKYHFSHKKNIQSNFKYIGYIPNQFSNNEHWVISGQMASAQRDVEVPDFILYGKECTNLCFCNINIDSNQTQYIPLGNFDENISCKLLENKVYICVYFISNNLYLKSFFLNYGKQNNSYKEIYFRELSDFLNHDNPVLYDTSNSNYKILCARNKENSEIICSKLYIAYSMDEDKSLTIQPASEFIIRNDILNKSEYNATFSYDEDNCNYTKFNNSEYLICCGKTDIIICERRDMELQLIDLFNITGNGKITNLTINNTNNEAITLIYNNKSISKEGHIYEYHIYPPKCHDILYEVYSSQLKSFYINIDDLFKRQTNTNYYIDFNTICNEFGKEIKISINNNLIQEIETKKFLIMNGSNLTFESDSNRAVENFQIKYNISIDETYSSECSLYLTIKHCYHSCKNCTGEIPNDDNHFCLSCKVDENYYPFSSSDSLNNCYNKQDMDSKQIPYYFDNYQKKFYKCHPNCYNCTNGFNSSTDNMNCISCKSGFYKLNGTNNCYNRTSLNESYYFNGNMFFHCDENCLTCSEGKNETSNNCISCDINKELYLVEKLNNCEYVNYSGYYLDENNDVKILKKCHHSCKSCNGPFYFDNITNVENHHCQECEENYQKLPNGSFPYNCYDNKTIYSLIFNQVEISTQKIELSTLEIESNSPKIKFKTSNLVPTVFMGIDIIKEKSTISLLATTNLNIDSTLSKLENDTWESNFTTSKLGFTTWKLDFTDKNVNIECYNTCLTCEEGPIYNESGIVVNHNCHKCKDGYYFKYGSENCYNNETIEKGYYLNIIANCSYDTYKFQPYEICLQYFPYDYEITPEENEKTEYITLSEFKTQLKENISDFINTANLSKVIDGYDFLAIIMLSNDMDPEKQLNKGISAINLGNCTNVLKEYYNISQDDYFYVLNIESKKMKLKKTNQKKIILLF